MKFDLLGHPIDDFSENRIGISEIILVFILTASISGLLLAVAGVFLPELVLCLGGLASVLYWNYFVRHGLTNGGLTAGLNWYHVLVILLVALTFRLPVFNYVFGGQDQGVYVNMASSIKSTGSIKPKDPVIDDFFGEHYKIYLKDNYASAYLPGVYRFVKEDGRMGVEFQFYHLFPIWMALMEGVVGAKGAVYALTFLSLMSLLLIYQFVNLATGQARYGLITALLVAVNPLHSIFSRWPVTEVPTLMFAVAGFFGVLAYCKSSDYGGIRACRFLFLSILSFACLFFTRISGFLYLPALFVIYFVALYSRSDEKFAKGISVWFWGIVAFFAISVWYGIELSSNYSQDIYRILFSRVFGGEWVFGVSLLSALFLGVAIWVLLARRNVFFRGVVIFIMTKIESLLGVFFCLIVVGSIYRIYSLAYTDRYASDPWIHGLWKLANKGLESVLASSMVVTVLAVTPFLVFIFSYFMLKKSDFGVGNVIKILVLVVFAYVTAFQFFVPYQPYYDRYLVSELVPYILISVGVFFAGMKIGVLRSIFGWGILLGGILAAGLSFMHVGKIEQAGAFEGLERIANKVGDNDIILLYGENLWGEIKTPLIFKFGKKVASISEESLKNKSYLNFIYSRYDNVYYLASKRMAANDFVEEGLFRVSYDKFDRTNLPAHTVVEKSYKMTLYRVNKSSLPPGIRAYGQVLSRFKGAAGVIEANGVRSNGAQGFLLFGPYEELPAGSYQLSVMGDLKNANSSWIDVVSDKGRVVHGRKAIVSSSEAGVLLTKLDIVLPENRTDVEVRVFVGENDFLNVSGYELVKINMNIDDGDKNID